VIFRVLTSPLGSAAERNRVATATFFFVNQSDSAVVIRRCVVPVIMQTALYVRLSGKTGVHDRSPPSR